MVSWPITVNSNPAIYPSSFSSGVLCSLSLIFATLNYPTLHLRPGLDAGRIHLCQLFTLLTFPVRVLVHCRQLAIFHLLMRRFISAHCSYCIQGNLYRPIKDSLTVTPLLPIVDVQTLFWQLSIVHITMPGLGRVVSGHKAAFECATSAIFVVPGVEAEEG